MRGRTRSIATSVLGNRDSMVREKRYGRELEGDKEVGENTIDLDGKAQLPYTRLREFHP
jgi:hypothetical protein